MKNRRGVRIREEREKAGLTLTDLAGMVGITAPYLSDIERGNRRGKYGTLKKIADALKIPVEEIWEVA